MVRAVGFLLLALVLPLTARSGTDVNDPPEIVTSEPPNLVMPVLLLSGADDRITDPSGAAVWREHVPHTEVILLPNVGHAPMLEVPRTAARYVADFLRRAVS